MYMKVFGAIFCRLMITDGTSACLRENPRQSTTILFYKCCGSHVSMYEIIYQGMMFTCDNNEFEKMIMIAFQLDNYKQRTDASL